MCICVECGSAVNGLCREFSKGNIRLTRCDICGNMADQYIEYDALNIFLDLILHKEQSYRHILFNRMAYVERGINRNLLKFACAVIFLDAYAQYFLIMKSSAKLPQSDLVGSYNMSKIIPSFFTLGWAPMAETQQDILLLILLILVFTTARFLVYVSSITVFCYVYIQHWLQKHAHTVIVMVKYNYLLMALVLSMYSKLGSLLMMIWDYEMSLRHIFQFFVFTSNVIAVKVFLNCRTLFMPFSLVLMGATIQSWFDITCSAFAHNFLN